MSAFVVGKTHIDALVTAGLSLGEFRNGSAMRWTARDLTQEEIAASYEAGEPWGPQTIENRRRIECRLDYDSADRTGAMLWAENVRSVNHRYAEEEIEDVYTFAKLPGRLDPVIALKAICCYVYQSCEHPGWQASGARHFCDVLRDRMISELPGINDAPYEIDDPNVFLTANAKALASR